MTAFAVAAGLPKWAGFTAGAHQWLAAVATWAPTGLETLVADVAAHEPTDGSYGRQAVAGATETVTPTVGVVYRCSDPTFPSQAGGEAWKWAVLATDTGSDATSIVMAVYQIARTSDGTDIVFHVPTGGLISFDL